MFPKISDLINYFLGTDLVLPFQTFGFFVALCFIVAYYVIDKELLRMEKLGVFPTSQQKMRVGGPMRTQDVWLPALIYALIAYKLGLMFEDYASFSENPQAKILSLEGSFPIALIVGVLTLGYYGYRYKQRQESAVEEVNVKVGIRDELGTIFTIAFVGGILGAKVFHNLEYIEDFMRDPIGQLLSFSGLTFYGGLIVAGLGIAYYVRRKGFEVGAFADAVAPALMLGYGVGRIGCQLSGDGDWGIVNTSPKPESLSFLPDWMWAFDYPGNVLNQVLTQPVWPTPFYETMMAFAIFGILWAVRKRLNFMGQMFGLYLFFNGLERFWIEKIRVNSKYHIFGAEITQAEIISTLLMIGGIALFIMAQRVWKKAYPKE